MSRSHVEAVCIGVQLTVVIHPRQLQEAVSDNLSRLKANSDARLLIVLLSLLVQVCQLDTNQHTPGKKESRLRKCIRQTSLTSEEHFLDCWLREGPDLCDLGHL